MFLVLKKGLIPYIWCKFTYSFTVPKICIVSKHRMTEVVGTSALIYMHLDRHLLNLFLKNLNDFNFTVPQDFASRLNCSYSYKFFYISNITPSFCNLRLLFCIPSTTNEENTFPSSLLIVYSPHSFSTPYSLSSFL